MRGYTPWRWRPHIELVGRHHLEAALERGHGAILWVAPFVFSSLVTKMALHEAGYAVSHLTRVSHGYSGSRFGMRVLNPLRSRIEERFLAKRVVIGADGSVAGPLKHLTNRLRANGVVSITIGAVGAKPCRCACLNGWFGIASGAPNLMVRTGAALLPVFTVKTGERHFTTTIESPLEAPGGADRDKIFEAVTRRCAEQLERYLVRWPDQFAWDVDLGRALIASAPR